jgi:hypothetical protein
VALTGKAAAQRDLDKRDFGLSQQPFGALDPAP